MAIREGRWDCPTCGHVGVLGREKICPSCGAPRPGDVRFYLPENAPVVTDKTRLQQAKAGPDWICEFCRSSTRGDLAECRQCGAAKGSSPVRATKDYAIGEVPRSGDADSAPPQIQQRLSINARRSADLSPFAKRRLIASAISAILLIGMMAAFVLWPRTAIVTVTEVSWNRSITIEQLRTVTEENWTVPAGGRTISQRRDVHHYDRVLDHYETRTRQVSEQVQVGTEQYVSGQRDMGNGFFQDIVSSRPVYETQYRTETYQDAVYRQEPVYRTKYKYDIDRWLAGRTVRSGGKDHAAYWPDFSLGNKERQGARSETYTVQLNDAKRQKQYTLNLAEPRWRELKPGDTCVARLTAFGGVRDIQK